MAYITKAEVDAKKAALKEINKKYGVKASFSGSNSMKLILTVQSGAIDFVGNYADRTCRDYVTKTGNIQVNHYYLDTQFSGVALEYLKEVYALMLDGHYDNSDIQTDYFECAWYNDIRIGKWNKPYVLIK